MKTALKPLLVFYTDLCGDDDKFGRKQNTLLKLSSHFPHVTT